MMIALAILGLGLLVIGAALPVGLRYTRESVNIATGQAAAEHALDLIEQNVCLPRVILDATSDPPPLVREPVLFQPRDAGGLPAPDPNIAGRLYEPVIKVRPLYTQNVNATPGSAYYGYQDDGVSVFNWNGVLVEDGIGFWLGADQPEECGNTSSGQWLRWALPSTALVYPPLTPDTPFLQADFFADKYQRRPVLDLNPVDGIGSETRKVLDSLISWTAFYRRVSYDDPNTPANEDDATLYEFITVAVRRPSVRHRFLVQHPSDAGMSGASIPLGVDSAVPIPWLVSFAQLPFPPGGFDNNTFYPLDANMIPMTVGQAPATMRFVCDPTRSDLFPVGSIFIPARNDVHPSTPSLGPGDYVSFGPPAPATLPIYEVIQRSQNADQTYTSIVKYNGYYPRQGASTPMSPSDWPVWVIPPAYEEGTSTNPVFPDRSPIVAVARRYVRLREIP